MKASRTRKSLSLKEKVGIIKEVRDNQHESRVSVAQRLGIPITTLNTIWTKRQEIEKSYAEAGGSSL